MAVDDPLLEVVGLSCGHGEAVVLSDLSFTLRAGRSLALLDQQKLPAGEVASGIAQQDNRLQREHEVPVKILMQAVEIAFLVAQQQRCRPRLPGHVALRQILGQRGGKTSVLAERGAPAVRDRRQRGVERRSKRRDWIG